MKLRALSALLLLSAPLTAQTRPVTLQSGPMVGASEMREVKLWAQTTGPARVKIFYWDSTAPRVRFGTNEVLTRRDSAYVAHLVADQVEPGRVYGYEVSVNGRIVRRPYRTVFRTPPNWSYRTDPPNFTVLLGSCLYVREPGTDRPGSVYGDSTHIVTAMGAKRADLMLWLGDNTYLREVDWGSWTGILRRWTHTRSLPAMQPMLADRANYAIWDDHEFGPNDADRGLWNKDRTRAAFELFFRNPSTGVPSVPEGITTQFAWGDVEFFLMDDRWFRAPDRRTTGPRPYFGDAQVQWLIDALASSRATFKVIAVGGQVLNPAALWENYATYPEERQRLLDAIAAERIPGVLFLSGDRHHTELTRLDRPGTYPLYDLTVSPLSAGVSAPAPQEQNTGRVEGTLVNALNFAALEFSGPRRNRTLTMRIFDSYGKELWNRSFTAAELGVTFGGESH
ncbi:MAG TPA: alkaline phosphatase D family protein [Gemmatimonadales bacterium]|nr:alkaline phosphatase D family protein [Gemmatimonadales bacterium]